jgi:hypothetical protein
VLARGTHRHVDVILPTGKHDQTQDKQYQQQRCTAADKPYQHPRREAGAVGPFCGRLRRLCGRGAFQRIIANTHIVDGLQPGGGVRQRNLNRISTRRAMDSRTCKIVGSRESGCAPAARYNDTHEFTRMNEKTAVHRTVSGCRQLIVFGGVFPRVGQEYSALFVISAASLDETLDAAGLARIDSTTLR